MPTTTVQSAVTLKASAGFIRTMNVCVIGSGDGMVCDAASVGAASAANAVLGTTSAQARAESFTYTIKCATGITVLPGTGQTLWLDWE